MRRSEFLQRAAGIEGRQELTVLVLAPRLARLGGHLRLPALEALHALQGGRRFVQRSDYLRTLIGALWWEHFPGLRIDTVSEAANDCKCLGLVHHDLLF